MFSGKIIYHDYGKNDVSNQIKTPHYLFTVNDLFSKIFEIDWIFSSKTYKSTDLAITHTLTH